MTAELSIPEISLPYEPSLAELEAMRQRVRAIHSAAVEQTEVRPFLLVTPLGLAVRPRLEALLAERGLVIAERIGIGDWAAASAILYSRTDDDERMRVALGFDALWRAISLLQQAERWNLADPSAFAQLVREKHAIRAALGTLRFRAHIPRVVLRSAGQIVRLQAIHVPDLDKVAAESRLLDVMVKHTTQ
jgi:hypothetical protein